MAVCYQSLREVDPEGFGVRNDLEFFEGDDKYLAQIEDADEKHFAYAAMVAGKLAERDDRTHFPWPSAKVVAYMDQGSGREYQGYQRFRYLVNHKYNPKSNSKNGQLFLTDRIVAVGRKATQYRLDASNLRGGKTISQTEIERKHGLLPLTSELWARLDSPRTTYR